MVIKYLSVLLLECEKAWAARDVIMCDLFEMFKSEDMLAPWEAFFENAGHDDDACAAPTFQMCDPDCDFLTAGATEQLYDAFHSRDMLLSPRWYFAAFCVDYDTNKESAEHSIQPVLIDLEMSDQSVAIANFQEGEEQTSINNLQMAEW